MNRIIPIIKYGLDLTDAKPDVSNQNEIIKLARKQSLLPLIYRAFNKLGVQNDELIKLCNNDIFRYINRDYTLQQIYKTLNGAGISFVPLKGAVLRDFYPEAWMRTSSDIDILIHEKDLQRALNALKENTDLKYKETAFHDVLMSNGAVLLELHFSIKEMMEKTDRLLGKAWDYSVHSTGCRCDFSPEYMIFYNVAHMAYHITHGGLGIRPFIDLYLLKTKTDYDEIKLRSLLETCELERFYDSCIKLLTVWFEDKESDPLTSSLEEYCFKGGVFGTKRNALEIYKGKRTNAGYVLHRLFENRYTMEQLYPVLKEKPYLLLPYQIKRWKKGLTKSRSNISGELKRLKKTKRDSAEKTGKLIRDLGL